MAGFTRLLLGLLLLPACWGVCRATVDSLAAASSLAGGFTLEAVAFLVGVVSFSIGWVVAPRPVRAYVLGHELTHALWAICFGARASHLRVTEKGGSVELTKTNLLITLAPYFFPFYTFVVVVAAALASLFVRPLPGLPAWSFLVGFTWTFHALFTFESLCQRQPDITVYGRVFSWAIVLIANLLLVDVGLAAATSLSLAAFGGFLVTRVIAAYVGCAGATLSLGKWIFGLCSRT